MNRIYQIAVIFILLCCSTEAVTAQNSYNHLEPVGGIYDSYDFQFEYYSKVRKMLFNGLTDSPEIRFQAMPSFTPENVLAIELDSKSSKYYMVYHICKQSIWYSKNWKRVGVGKLKTEIDEESVRLIKSLFDVAIAQTRYSKEDIMGLDSESYYFSIAKYGIKSGAVWSPPNGSKMGKLVDIGLKLVELAKSGKSMIKVDEQLKKEIEQLIDELREQEM